MQEVSQVVSINPWNSGNIVALRPNDFVICIPTTLLLEQPFPLMAASHGILLPTVAQGLGESTPECPTPRLPGTITDGCTCLWGRIGKALIQPTRLETPAIGIGVWVYISKDEGRTWGAPIPISENRDDDKQWAASDQSNGSPHYGNVYVAWGAGTPLHFGRSQTSRHCVERAGELVLPAQSILRFRECLALRFRVGPDGTIYIFWHNDGYDSVELVKSTDGGQSFTASRQVVKGITSIRGSAPSRNGWPHFPGGRNVSCHHAGDSVRNRSEDRNRCMGGLPVTVFREFTIAARPTGESTVGRGSKRRPAFAGHYSCVFLNRTPVSSHRSSGCVMEQLAVRFTSLAHSLTTISR